MLCSRSALRGCCLTLGICAALAVPAVAQADRVAVVIGVGSYGKLDASLDLPGASEGARALAQVLEHDAGYDQVLSLTDALATRSAIRDLLLENLPAQLTVADSLLVYFAGHGVGGDFGEPYLMPYDVDPDDLQGTAIAVDELSSSLRNSPRVGSLVMVTDAVHDMRLGDLVLVGPNAKSWPDAVDEFFSLSACSPREIPATTPFGEILAQGMAGDADTSTNGAVSASELFRYMLDGMAASGVKAHPAEAGTYDPELVVARVRKGPHDFAPPPEPEPRSARPRRMVGAGLTGLGVGVAGGGVAFYFHGRSNYQAANAPDADASLVRRYQRDQRWAPILLASGGATVLTGGVLLVIPSPTGATVGVSLDF